jgi:hypothetical protein
MLRPLLLALLIASPALAVTHQTAQPFVGVTHHRFVQSITDAPAAPFLRPVVVDVLEIDVRAEGVAFLMQPGNGDAPGEITRITTRAFVDDVKAQIGINVGFYDTAAKYGGMDTDLMHLAASKGDVYSAARGGEATFNITEKNIPEILEAGPANAATLVGGKKVFNAAGGNQRILKNGEVSAPRDANYTKALNPHTALGVSRDKRRVFLATVDGRQKGYAEGMRTDEFAVVLQQLGAWDAVNLDGGGSTTMVMDDTHDGVQNARLVNSPSDNSSSSQPGRERVVANSFAVFAKPNPDYKPLPPAPRPVASKVVREVVKELTVLDDFEAGKGHFNAGITSSGTTKNVDEKSSAMIDDAAAHDGKASLRLDVRSTSDAAQQGMILRVLSGAGNPDQNLVGEKTLGNDGYIGFWLRAEPGNSGPLFVTIFVDDAGADGIGTERGDLREVKADGQWHLFQWNVNEDGRWSNIANGNGVIDGANLTLDSIVFSTSKDMKGGGAFDGRLWIDAVIYSPGERIERGPTTAPVR